jgi:hypothetical protein
MGNNVYITDNPMTPAKTKQRNNGRKQAKRKNNRLTREGPPMMIRSAYRITVPPSRRVTLDYSADATFSSAAGTAELLVFRGNSGYDPEYTTTGAQPFLWDQMSAMYLSYFVHASRINVQTYDVNSTPATGIWKVGMAPSFIATDFSGISPEDLGEVPGGRYKVMNYHEADITKNTFSTQISTAALAGIPNHIMQPGNVDWSANVTANPSKAWYWSVVAQPADESSSATLDARIKLQYDVTFYLRSYPGTSLCSQPHTAVKSTTTTRPSRIV